MTRPVASPPPTRERSAAAGLIVLFVAVVAVLTPLRPDLSLRDNQISDFLSGSYRWLAVVGFLCLSAGTALLARAELVRARPVGRVLVVYAGTVLVSGLTGPTTVLHNIAALTAFTSIPVGIVLGPWSRRVRWTWTGLVAASLATWPLGVGWGERLTVLLELAWLVALSLGAPDRR